MKTCLRKLVGASAGVGALGGCFVVALTGLILAFPSLAHAQEEATSEEVVLAVSFASNEQALGAISGTLGFVSDPKGGEIDVSEWNEVSTGNGTKTITATDDSSYTLEWHSNNSTWSSGNSGSLIECLTRGYLDNGANSQNRITLTGMPPSGYDVAIIGGGDGGKFSAYNVNGLDYTYDETAGRTRPGSGNWGTRAGASVLTEGTNVLYIRGQTAATLEISSYYKSGNPLGRGTTAALMVFFRDVVTVKGALPEDATAFSEVVWEGGAAPQDGQVAEVTVPAGKTLLFDAELPQLLRLKLITSGHVTVTCAEGVALSDQDQVEIEGSFDFGAQALTMLALRNGATARVDTRSQIGPCLGSGTLILDGDTALTALDLTNDSIIPQGDLALGIAQAATVDLLPITGRALTFYDGADVTVNTRLRTADTGTQSSTVNHLGGTVTCDGADGENYKLGPFVLSHWNAATTYSLTGGTLNVSNAPAKIGADGQGHLAISDEGVANFHSLSIRQGTVTVTNGGTLNVGTAAGAAITRDTTNNKDGGTLTFGGGTLGTWTGTELTVNGAVNFTAGTVTTVRTTTVEETPKAATITFAGSASGTGALKIEGSGEVDMTALSWRPMLAGLEAGATLKMTPTAQELFDAQLRGGPVEALFLVTEDAAIEGKILQVIDGVSTECTLSRRDGILVASGASQTQIDVTTTGDAWWLDYEFNGGVTSSGRDTSELSWDNGHPYTNNEYVDAAPPDNNKALLLPSRPWRSVDYPAAFTAVMRCKANPTQNSVLVAFGSGEGTCIILAAGADPVGDTSAVPQMGDMRLLLWENGVGMTQLGETMQVPYATDAYHLYAFSLIPEAGGTRVAVYVDGVRKANVKHTSTIQLSAGLQLASCFRGTPTSATYPVVQPSATDTGTIDFLRVADSVFAPDTLGALSKAYAYESPLGSATRTVSAVEAWDGTGATPEETTTPWSQGGTAQAAPNAGTNITLTTTADDASLTLNNSAAVTYESLTVTGTGKLALTGGSAERKVTPVLLQVGADLTIPHGVVEPDTVVVEAGKTLTYTIPDSWFDTPVPKTYQLCGVATLGDGSAIAVTPTALAGREARVVQTASGTYEVVVEPNATGLMAKVTGEMNWADLTWEANTVLAGERLVLVAEGNATLKVDDASVEEVSKVTRLATSGEGTLVFANPYYLTNCKTLRVGGNLEITPAGIAGFEQAIIESGKTFTYKPGTGFAPVARQISGEGTLVLDGEGTLVLSPTSAEERAVLDGAHIEVRRGTLATSLDAGDPLIRNGKLTFADGTFFKSHGRVDVDGTVTINNAGALEFQAYDGVVPAFVSMAGVTSKLVKEGAGELTLTFYGERFTGNVEVTAGTLAIKAESDGSVSPAAEVVVFPKAISGAGALRFVSGQTKLSTANTYQGGTTIDSGATVTIVNRLGINNNSDATLKGAGRLIVTGTYSGNASPLGMMTDATWTGTVEFRTVGKGPNYTLGVYGNAASEIEFNGATGWMEAGTRATASVRLTGDGLMLQNGNSTASDAFAVYFDKVVGTGAFRGTTGANVTNTPEWKYDVVMTDVSGFAGSIDLSVGVNPGGCGVLIGGTAGALPTGFAPADYRKHITILEGATATVAEGQTWSVTSAGQVRVRGTLAGTGTIGSSAEKGTLTFADGATLDAQAAVEGKALTAAGEVNFGGALTIVLGDQTDRQFYVLKGTVNTRPTSVSIQRAGAEITTHEYGVDATGLYVTLRPDALPTWTLPEGTDSGAWTNLAYWSNLDPAGQLPADDASVTIKVPTGRTMTVELGADAPAGTVYVVGGGTVKLTGAGKLAVANSVVVRAGQLESSSANLSYSELSIAADQTATLTVDDAAWESGRVTGAGKLIKKGTGKLRLTVPSALLQTVAEDATIEIQAGGLETWLLPTDYNPILRDVKLRFAEGTTFTSHGWLGLAGTVEVEAAGALTFAAASTHTPSIQGSGTLKKTGVGTLTITLFDALTYSVPMEVAEGTLALTTNNETATPTIASVISGKGGLTIASGTVILTGANTYEGVTTVAEGALLSVADISKLAGSSQVQINGTLKFTANGGTNQSLEDLSTLAGTGTVWYAGSNYKTLPSAPERRFPSTLALRNDQGQGLVLAGLPAEQQEVPFVIEVGTLSGAQGFRADWDPATANTRDLRIVQAANSEHTGNLVMSNQSGRLRQVLVAGAAGAVDKTLTLSGATTTARPLVVEPSGHVALTGSWAGAVTVEGILSGAGTVGGNLTLAEGAEILLPEAADNALTVNGTAALDGAVTFRAPKPLLDFLESGKVLLRFGGTAALPNLDLSLVTLIDSDGVTVTQPLFLDSEARVLRMGERPYSRTLGDEAEPWVKAGAWTKPDGTLVDAPPEGATVEVTLTEGSGVLTVATAPLNLKSLTVVGEGTLHLEFADWLTDAQYEAIPMAGTTQTLLAAAFDPEQIAVRLLPLRYGALATIQVGENLVTAQITLPMALYPTDNLKTAAVNFWRNGHADTKLDTTATTPEGLDAYALLPEYWSQEDNGGATGTVTVSTIPFGQRATTGATKTALGTLNFTASSLWGAGSNATILKGYLEDSNLAEGVGSPSITLDLPDDFGPYTVIVYGSSDSNNLTYTPRKVNGVWYTYNSVGALTPLAADEIPTAPGDANDWGDTDTRDRPVAGVNAMVVPGQTGDLSIEGYKVQDGNDPSVRGTIAAIQIVQEAFPELDRARAFTAEVSGSIDWAAIEWKLNGTATTEDPTATDSVLLTLTGDTKLTAEAAMAVDTLAIYGNGYSIACPDREQMTVDTWVFQDDVTFALTSAAETLPENRQNDPRRLRYDYGYKADAGYPTSPAYEVEFANGYEAPSPVFNGGLIEFSGGTVKAGSVNFSGTRSELIISGTTSLTTTTFCLGEIEATIRDSATVEADRLVTGDGGANRTSILTLTDSATFTVTGNNEGTGNDNTSASLLFSHWNSTTSVSVRGKAQLLAEQVALVLSHDGQTTLEIADEATVKVKGLLNHRANKGDTVILSGGLLQLGSLGMRREGSRQISLDFAGGTMAFQNDFTFGADTAAMCPTVTGSPRYLAMDGATLTFTQPRPFLAQTAAAEGEPAVVPATATLQGDSYRIAGATFATDASAVLHSLAVECASLELAADLAVPNVSLRTGMTLALDGGFLTADTWTLPGTGESLLLSLPVREKLSTGGYLSTTGALPSLASVNLELVLDADRPDTDSILPQIPIMLGAYAAGDTPALGSIALRNNSNGAIDTWEPRLTNGDLGAGLYLALTGNEVLNSSTIDLPYTPTQAAADSWPFMTFLADGADDILTLPAEGLAIAHATFAGTAPITVTATGTEPAALLQGRNFTFTVDTTFDLSTWGAAARAAIARGAVRDLPASVCLVGGGVTVAPGVTLAVTWHADTPALPAGFEERVEVTPDGVYYVVTSARTTRSASLNFTTAAIPLVAPPEAPGAYAVPLAAWNDLTGAFNASTLLIADRNGMATEQQLAEGEAPLQLMAGAASATAWTEANVSMLKAWLNDTTEQTLALYHVPFEQWRLVLIFATDRQDAAWATPTVNEALYAMDGAGYVRRNLRGHRDRVPADTAWGSTTKAEAAAPTVLGVNTLVTDVLTTPDATITLPAFTYGSRYAGLAALQIVEAPAITAPAAATYSYTFADGGAYNLGDLTLTLGTGTAKWTSGATHTLALTIPADKTVTLTLPTYFEAAAITATGGSLELKVAQGGVNLATLDAGGLDNVTVHFDCDNVAFTPAKVVTRFEAAFNNNGQPYLIEANQTLALGEESPVTTSLESSNATLTIDGASAGTLRIDATRSYTGNLRDAWNDLTIAGRDLTFGGNPDNSNINYRVEAGDVHTHTGRFHLRRDADWSYTQTGGQSYFRGEAAGSNPGGMLAFNSYSGTGLTATIDLSGDDTSRLEATGITLWASGSTANMKVRGEATLALGAEGFNAYGSNSAFSVTFENEGTLCLIDATLPKTGSGSAEVGFEGGRITTATSAGSLTCPVAVNSLVDAPTILAPAVMGPLTLGAANTGSGYATVSQGKVVLGHAQALGSWQVTVAAGATLEVATAADANSAATVEFEAGAILSVTTADTPTLPYTVKVAGELTGPTTGSVDLRLNGLRAVGVLNADGTVTFNSTTSAAPVEWNTGVTAGTWQHQVAGPWKSDLIYYDGVGVTFPTPTANTAVTVNSVVKPSALAFGAAGSAKYTFTGGTADAAIDLKALSGTIPLGVDHVYEVPVIVDSLDDVLQQTGTTQRLFGVLADDGVTATYTNAWSTTATVVSLSPRAGETQKLHLTSDVLMGNGTLVVSGQVADDQTVSGGTVRLTGTLTKDWNNAFAGSIQVQNGATLKFDYALSPEDLTTKGHYPFFRAGETDLLPNGTLNGRYTLENGATLVLNDRGVIGGWASRNSAEMLTSQPITIGANSTVRYTYGYQHARLGGVWVPYGFRFTGEGATLDIADTNTSYGGLRWLRGATMTVTGTDTTMADGTTGTAINAYLINTGVRGIFLALAKDNEELSAYDTATTLALPAGVTDGYTIEVGAGSTFHFEAPILGVHPESPVIKRGAGRLALAFGTLDLPLAVEVQEGILGGSATLTGSASSVEVAAGAAIEAGLTLANLTLDNGAILRLDPRGRTMLRADRATFASGASYTVDSMVDDLLKADAMAAVKIFDWGAAENVGAVTFVPGVALTEKGYGLEVREDGLYAMKQVVYIRNLYGTKPSSGYTLAWQDAAWVRGDDATATLTTFNPDVNEAAVACIVVPDEWATGGLPAFTFQLTEAVSFSAIRFITRSDYEADGALQATARVPGEVVYAYNLSRQTLPGVGESASFTWVSTLTVEVPPPSRVIARVTTEPISGYTVQVSDRTVVIYQATSEPVLNVNFTGRGVGDPSWVAGSTGLCGVVPFSGVYWNNATPSDFATGDEGGVLSGYRLQATVFGAEQLDDSGNPVPVVVPVSYLTATPVQATRTGSANAVLASSFLPGANGAATAATLASLQMDASDTTSKGWRVRVGNLPFAAYDLYLLFAATSDGSTTYPTVRVKVGDGAWATYGMADGWATRSLDAWTGSGGLVDGAFVAGQNVLHLRLASVAGQSLEICANDTTGDRGLAALQIIRCDDVARYDRVGAGNWSDGAGWQSNLGGPAGGWTDASPAAPHSARLNNISTLAVDQPVTLPFLKLLGASTTTLTGSAGYLRTPVIDAAELGAGAMLRLQDAILPSNAQIFLAPEMKVTLPEGEAGTTTTNDWRWVYESTDAHTATLQKTQAGDLVLVQPIQHRLQIDGGTLWLSTEKGDYARSADISGAGFLGKTGPGTLTLEWNNLGSLIGDSEGVVVRVNEGTLLLPARNDGALPANKKLLAEGAGTLRLTGSQESDPFKDGTLLARDGGRVQLASATNLFKNDSRPDIRLEGALYENTLVDGAHYHVKGFTSTGDSAAFFDGEGRNAWARQSLNIHSGRLQVEGGALALYPNNVNRQNYLYVRAVAQADLADSWGGAVDVAANAAFYSDHPICGGAGTGTTLYKMGAGEWVQTCTLSNRQEDNGGNDAGSCNGAIQIVGGALRWNLGAGKQNPRPKAGELCDLIIDAGARMDGAGAIHNTDVIVKAGATLASGLPQGWQGISPQHRYYERMPASFKGEAEGSIHKLHIFGAVTFEDEAVLEVDLATTERLTVQGPLDVADGGTTAAGDITFGETVVVRLVNLPSSVPSTGLQLTDFKVAPSVEPTTIECADAVALDATVVFENGNLWLKPSNNSYLWTTAEGAWSDSAWTFGGATVAFPQGSTLSPLARVLADGATDVKLTVDQPTPVAGATEVVWDWVAGALTLSATQDRTVTLAAMEPATGSTEIAGVVLDEALWKVGAGAAVVQAPVRFAYTGESGSLHVKAGTLTVEAPLTAAEPFANTLATTLPEAFSAEIAEGASLVYQGAEAVQSFAGGITGAGTLAVKSGASVVLGGTAANGLAYVVDGASLELASGSADLGVVPRRSVTVTSAGRLKLSDENALGKDQVTDLTLAAAPADTSTGTAVFMGAAVELADKARLQGTVTVTGTGEAQLGTAANNSGALTGDLTVTVPQGATLTMDGSWETPVDTTSGRIVKQGDGVWALTGAFGSNLPVSLEGGRTVVQGGLSVYVDNGNATRADWSVEAGATLTLASSAEIDLNSGSLTVQPGATLELASGSQGSFVSALTLGDSSTLKVATLGSALQLAKGVTLDGAIAVNLDALDIDALTSTSYTILRSDVDFAGSGRFVLSGAKLLDWAKAGWSLRVSADLRSLSLESFGATNVYSWEATEAFVGENNWMQAAWRVSGKTELQPWPDTNTGTEPAARFADTTQEGVAVPTVARVVDWSEASAQSVRGVMVENNQPAAGDATANDYTLTAASTVNKQLTVNGEFLKSGSAAVRVERPVAFGGEGALSVLGGSAVFTHAVTSVNDTLTKPVTLAGATLRFEGEPTWTLDGMLNGDGTGVIEKAGTGNLVLKSDTADVAALNAVGGGRLELATPNLFTLAPAVTLDEKTFLSWSSVYDTMGEVELAVNAGAAAPVGSFRWAASVPTDSTSAVRLAAKALATTPAVNVERFVYAPQKGHLILDPGADILPAQVSLALDNGTDAGAALWLGARGAAGESVVVGELTGEGLVGVEPILDETADPDWQVNRTITVKLAPADAAATPTFGGRFMGARAQDGTAIQAGLNLQALDTTQGARFIYRGISNHAQLGTFAIGPTVRAEINGTWTGAVTIADGATLAGSGTVGDTGRELTVNPGAWLEASAWGERSTTTGPVAETIPSTLTLKGALAMTEGSGLRVLVRKGANGSPWVSCVEAESLVVPTQLPGKTAIELKIDLDIEPGAYASDVKILGWTTKDGLPISGVLTINGGANTEGYTLKQKADGLYLRRTNARFWMILL